MADKTTEVLLRYTADVSSAVAGNKTINDSLTAIKAKADAEYVAAVSQVNQRRDTTNAALMSIRSVADATYDKMIADGNRAYDSAAQAAKDSAAKQSAAIQSVIRDIGAQKVALQDLPDPAVGSFAGEGGSGGFDAKQIGARAAGLGSVLGSSLGGEGLRDINQIIQLGVAGGVSAAGVGVLAVGLKLLSNNAEEAAKDIEVSAKAYSDVAERALTSTHQQLESERDALLLRIKLDQQLADQANKNVADYALNTQGFGALNLALDGTFKGLQGSANDANDKLKATQNELNAYNIVLGGNLTATNDLNEVEKELLKTREALASAAIAQLDQEANTRLQLASLRRTGTTDQVNAELDANKDRETIIRNYLLPSVALLGLGADAAKKRTDELNLELQHLTESDQLLLQAVLPVVAQRDAEIALLKAQKDASDDLNKTLQDINKTTVDLGEANDKVTSTYATLMAADTEHTANLKDIQTQRDTAETEAKQKLSDKIAQLDEQAAQRTKEQHERDNLSIRDAEASGNFARVQQILAAQKLDDKQRAEQVQDQKNDASKAYGDALKAADVQNKKLLASETERYQKEHDQRQQAYAKALQDQQTLTRQLQSLRDQESIQTKYWISAQVTALYRVQDATSSFTDKMGSYADRINSWIAGGGAAWKDVGSGMTGGSTGPSSATALRDAVSSGGKSAVEKALDDFYKDYQRGTTGGGRATATSFDTGGIVTKPGFAWLGVKGERYTLPMAEKAPLGRSTGGSNSSLKITVRAEGDSATNRAAAKEIATQVVNEAFRQYAVIVDQDE